LTSQASLAPSVIAPSVASDQAAELLPPMHFPTPVQQAAQIVVQTITDINITQLATSFKIWHMLVVYAGDLFLLYVFNEVGGAFLETNNRMLCAQLAADALSVIFLAYTDFQDTLDPTLRDPPEDGQSHLPLLRQS
jgi:hypothetical protein